MHLCIFSMLFSASLSMSGGHLNLNSNNISNQSSALTKKAYLGSNTSIGRNNRDANIPVRAVSPRVRWVEDKPSGENFLSQQISASNQNVSYFFLLESGNYLFFHQMLIHK